MNFIYARGAEFQEVAAITRGDGSAAKLDAITVINQLERTTILLKMIKIGRDQPTLDESLPLILEVFGLLPRESWHRKGTSITLARHAVTSLAIA